MSARRIGGHAVDARWGADFCRKGLTRRWARGCLLTREAGTRIGERVKGWKSLARLLKSIVCEGIIRNGEIS